MNRRWRRKIAVAAPIVLIAGAAVLMRSCLGPVYGIDSTPLHRIESEDTAILAYAPDGSFLTDLSMNGITIRNPITGEAVRSFDTAEGAYTTTDVSPDGSRIAIGGVSRDLTVFDIATGETVLSCTHAGMARSIAFSPDGRRVSAATSDFQASTGSVQVWDARSGARLLTLDRKTYMTATGFSPDGTMLLSGEWDATRTGTNPGSGVTFWDAQSGKAIRRIALPVQLISNAIFSPDGKHVLVVVNDRDVWLYEIAAGKQIIAYSAHEGSVSGAGFSPDGRRVVVGDSGLDTTPPSTTGWSLRSVIKSLGLESHVEDLYAILGMRYQNQHRGSVFIYDTETAELLKVLRITEDPLHWMDVSPDGRHIATSTGNAVAIWDVGDVFYESRGIIRSDQNHTSRAGTSP